MNIDTMKLYPSLSPTLEEKLNTTLGEKGSGPDNSISKDKKPKPLVQITMNNMAKKSFTRKTSNFIKSEPYETAPPKLHDATQNYLQNRSQEMTRYPKFDETKFLKKLYIYKLPLDVNPDEIQKMFQQFGKIVDVDYKKHKNTTGITCRIDFYSMKSVQAALRSQMHYRGAPLDIKPGRIPQKYNTRVKYDIVQRYQLQGADCMNMSPKMPFTSSLKKESRVFLHGMAEPLTKHALEKSICLFLHGFNINNVFVEFKPYVSQDKKLQKCGFVMIHGFQHEFAAALIKVQEKFEILGTTVTCWLPPSEDAI
jgi:RNA recognition motif-containing protein